MKMLTFLEFVSQKFKNEELLFSEQGEMMDQQAQIDMEKRQTYINPMMSKEFFLSDYEYKGHTITLKSLGTGIGKPVLSYVDNEDFEIFADKEVAKKETMKAIDRLVAKKLESIKDLRKTQSQLKREFQQAQAAQAAQKAQEMEMTANKDK